MKRPLACILGWNNWIMDLSDFTEYQSNNRRNKCKSSAAGCWILNIILGPTQKMCNPLSSAHTRWMRGCQMSRPWCWCPGNVWTSALESEECLHAARAGVGIIRLRLRSTPAVSRDPSTVHRVQQPGPGLCQSVNTEIIFLVTWSFIYSRETEDTVTVDLFREEDKS